MRLVLDGKSLALGIIAGAALIAGLGAMQTTSPQVGRFKIVATGAGQGTHITAYVLDTATGQVWQSNRNDWNEKKLKDDQ